MYLKNVWSGAAGLCLWIPTCFISLSNIVGACEKKVMLICHNDNILWCYSGIYLLWISWIQIVWPSYVDVVIVQVKGQNSSTIFPLQLKYISVLTTSLEVSIIMVPDLEKGTYTFPCRDVHPRIGIHIIVAKIVELSLRIWSIFTESWNTNNIIYNIS